MSTAMTTKPTVPADLPDVDPADLADVEINISPKPSVITKKTPQQWGWWTARVLSYFTLTYLLITEAILAIGFFLLLFGANPSSGFVSWIYQAGSRAMEPFSGMFEPIMLGTNNGDIPAILDTSVLFAMLIYGIAALLVDSLIKWLSFKLHTLEADKK